jgi:hypothetical protein
MRHLSKAIVAAFALLTLALVSGWVGAFVLRNDHLVTIYMPEPRWSVEQPLQTVIWDAHLSGLVLGTVALGIVISAVGLVLPVMLRAVYERRRSHRLIRALEEELGELRQLQLVEPMPLSDLEQERSTTASSAPSGVEPDDDPFALLELGDAPERRS